MHIVPDITPASTLGNLISEGRFREAITLGERMLADNPDDPSILINLMDACFKARNLSPDYFDKSTHYARRAILCGHNTGYAHERLAINLEKTRQYHKALRLYALILDTPGFHFDPHGVGNTIDFAKRRAKALAKLPQAEDTPEDTLFSEEEIKRILSSII